MSKIDLTWIAKEMIPGKWYNINDEEQLKQYMQISFNSTMVRLGPVNLLKNKYRFMGICDSFFTFF